MSDIEHFYWQAFWELSTERQASMGGKTPIPWSAIRRYGAEFAPSMAEFAEVIRRMDMAYTSHNEGESGR